MMRKKKRAGYFLKKKNKINKQYSMIKNKEQGQTKAEDEVEQKD